MGKYSTFLFTFLKLINSQLIIQSVQLITFAYYKINWKISLFLNIYALIVIYMSKIISNFRFFIYSFTFISSLFWIWLKKNFF